MPTFFRPEVLLLILPLIAAETMPRFDMTDKDGIIFDPIAPRAGERLTAKCTLVGLTPNDKRHVSDERSSSLFDQR